MFTGRLLTFNNWQQKSCVKKKKIMCIWSNHMKLVSLWVKELDVGNPWWLSTHEMLPTESRPE